MLRPATAKKARMEDGDGNGMCFPSDVLLDILSRLPSRAIAQSRTICRSWRTVVDAHALLLFSSRSFPGVFTNHTGCRDSSIFLAPPASRVAHDFRRPLFWHGWAHVEDHCNGLLLLYNPKTRHFGSKDESDTYVCNPATIRCDPLPCPPPKWWEYDIKGTFLVFDPAVSLHYEVYKVSQAEFSGIYSKVLGFEEPNSSDVVCPLVFSSQTRQWERREFLPGRCAPVDLQRMKAPVSAMWQRQAAEDWGGSLYVDRHNGVLMILRCLEGIYDLVQLPREADINKGVYIEMPRRSLLASYEKGIQYAQLNRLQLQVWALTGLGDGQLGWKLVHNVDLEPHIPNVWKTFLATQPRMEWEMVGSTKSIRLFTQKDDTTEGVEDEEVEEEEGSDGDDEDGIVEEQDIEVQDVLDYSWNSDEDNFIQVDKSTTNIKSMEQNRYCGIIGLHPHKDVLLLYTSFTMLAYHFATSRIQYLRYGLHDRESMRQGCEIEGTFPYRPCYVDLLPTRKIACPLSVHTMWKSRHCAN